MNKPSSASATRPEALFLSPESPYPPIGGGPLRSASLLEYLSCYHTVDLVTFSEAGQPDPSAAIPPGKVRRADAVALPYHSRRMAARLMRNARRALRAAPPLVDRFSGFDGRVESLLEGRRYELGIIEHFWCAGYVQLVRARAKQVVLDLHNIESLWHESLAVGQSPFRAAALRRFATAARRLEQKLWPQFDVILVASEHDASRVRPLARGSQVVVYPNALPEIPLPAKIEREEIVFSGNLEYEPNIEAIRYFRRNMWPLLRFRPGLKWRIIGKNPGSVRALVSADSRIELSGPVSDAVTELARSQVAVVPVLSGSGTRLKILEAWAAATAVVSTTFGAEGLGQAGEHLLVGDNPRDFAALVLRLLDSPEERRRLGSAGRQLYEQSYTWPAAWQRLQGIF
ncbi:MAG TPA: glycosyltransferase family 4 protein [Bryobacteraceae bacterium]|nr:glycosyltransferase family 4 protein [Bryobacteraceae bacterium]